MAALPDFTTPPTVTAIYGAYVQNAWAGESWRISMSDMGQECDRRIWSKLRWLHEPEVFDGLKLRLFKTGHAAEARLLEDLGVAGINVEAKDPSTGRQWEVILAGGHLRGKVDAKGTGFPEAPVAEHVVECKSMSAKAFNRATSGPMKTAKPEHYVTVQLYMHGLGLQRAAYLVENREDSSLHMERVNYDHDFALRAESRAERIVKAAKPPQRLHDDPEAKGAWVCRSCPALGVCHKGDWSRRTCRSCIHAEAQLDGVGTWTCARFDRVLSIDDQKAGCGAHLYIPALVDGTVTRKNAREEWIEYRLSDGTIWRDEAAPPTVPDAVAEPTPEETRAAIAQAVEGDEVAF